MIMATAIAPEMLDRIDKLDQDATKLVMETAMALHYVARGADPDWIDRAAHHRAVARIAAIITGGDWLMLAENRFLIQQCITPYVFLRHHSGPLPAHEALLGYFRRCDTTMREQTPYRCLERRYLLAAIDGGDLPRLADQPIMGDAECVAAFNRELGYAFTHAAFFTTDFGFRPRRDPCAAAVALCVLAQAARRNDVDLAMEAAIAMLACDAGPADRDAALAAIGLLIAANPALTEPGDGADYHPKFVLDILRCLVWRRYRRDLLAERPARAGALPVARLGAVLVAMTGKDPGAMLDGLRGYEDLSGHCGWLRRLIALRLDELGDQARARVLFEREFAHLGQRSPAVYPGLLARLRTFGAVLAAPAG